MKYWIIFVFLVISVSIHAQIVDLEKNTTDSTSHSKLTGETWFEPKGYIGEQFFNKSWMQSDLLLSTGEMVYGEKVKYNGFLDELIWVNSIINQQFKLDKPLIKAFRLINEQGQIRHFKQIIVSNPTSTNQQLDIFVEVEVEGKISLYIQRKINVVNTEDIVIDGTLCRQGIIKPTPQYYLKLSSTDYILLDIIKLKSFIQLFPSLKKQTDLVIRKNNLKLKTEEDLVKLIKLLNAQEN